MEKLVFLIMSWAILTLLSISCANVEDSIHLNNDPKAMKKEVLKRVPLGSRIEDAKRKMEKSDFLCTMMHNEEFAVQKDNPSDNDPFKSTLHEKADFLLCEKRKQTAPMVSQEWSIVIMHKGGIVSDVYVNVGITGP